MASSVAEQRKEIAERRQRQRDYQAKLAENRKAPAAEPSAADKTAGLHRGRLASGELKAEERAGGRKLDAASGPPSFMSGARGPSAVAGQRAAIAERRKTRLEADRKTFATAKPVTGGGMSGSRQPSAVAAQRGEIADRRRTKLEADRKAFAATKPNGGAPASVTPSMAQGGPSAPAKPLVHPSSKDKPAKLASEDIMPAKPSMHPKGEQKPEPKKATPARKAAPAKKAVKKDHSGDPRYTTPPFTPKADQPAAKKGENRADKMARLNAKSKAMNIEHRASKPGRPAAPSDSTGKDWMKRRGVKTDRR